METELIAAGEFSGVFVVRGVRWIGLETGEADKWRQTEVLGVATPLHLPPHCDGYMTYDNISALFEGGITRAINVTVTPTLAPPQKKSIPTN